jgi:hypothetical protein
MAKYVSEFDQWLKRFKQSNPDTEQKQREGRALLWDKQPDLVNKSHATVTNKQSGYVYYK